MTAIQAWEEFKTLISKDANGNISIGDFVVLFNRAQVEYMSSFFADGINASTRNINALIPFRVPQGAPRVVPVIDRLAVFQNGDFAFGPELWTMGYSNPECGDGAPDVVERQVELLDDAQWASRTASNYKYPTLKYPVARLAGTDTVEILPSSVNYVGVIYIRLPRPINVATATGSDGVMYPDPNSTANSDPEWNDVDVRKIISWIIGDAGVREQNPQWEGYGERRRK